MAEKGTQNPPSGTESDISKAQAQQQPPNQANQQLGETGKQQGQFETGQQEDAELTRDKAATGQAEPGAGPDEGLQGETATRQRTDIEGGSLASEPTGEPESGFVGAQGQRDTSNELIEDEDKEDEDFTPEGK